MPPVGQIASPPWPQREASGEQLRDRRRNRLCGVAAWPWRRTGARQRAALVGRRRQIHIAARLELRMPSRANPHHEIATSSRLGRPAELHLVSVVRLAAVHDPYQGHIICAALLLGAGRVAVGQRKRRRAVRLGGKPPVPRWVVLRGVTLIVSAARRDEVPTCTTRTRQVSTTLTRWSSAGRPRSTYLRV